MVIDKTNKDALATVQRWAWLLIVVAMILLFTFFAYHQSANTGFFTAKFGPLEMFFLYGPILGALGAPIARAWTGRQNPARLLEGASNLFLLIGSLWLVIVFPFDFTHLADALPSAIRFALSWITNDIGKAVMILQIIAGTISLARSVIGYR